MGLNFHIKWGWLTTLNQHKKLLYLINRECSCSSLSKEGSSSYQKRLLCQIKLWELLIPWFKAKWLCFQHWGSNEQRAIGCLPGSVHMYLALRKLNPCPHKSKHFRSILGQYFPFWFILCDMCYTTSSDNYTSFNAFFISWMCLSFKLNWHTRIWG